MLETGDHPSCLSFEVGLYFDCVVALDEIGEESAQNLSNFSMQPRLGEFLK